MSDLDYDALRKVAEAATPGPWECDERGLVDDLHLGSIRIPVLRPLGTYGPKVEDARHMAAFDPPTVLRLLDLAQRAEAAEAAVERVRALADHWASDPHSLHGIRNAAECAAYDLRAALNPEADQ